MRPLAERARYRAVHAAQPGCWLGREAVADRTLRAGGKTIGGRGTEITNQLRSRRGKHRTRRGGTAETFKGSLTQLMALTRRASLFIGGDTGPMHLAAALSVPVVGIFGPTNPVRNGPFGARNSVLRSPSGFTSYKHLAEPDHGLLEITAGQVVAAA